MASDVVWWPGAAGADPGRVAVVSVSYNTRELTALLLWSLCEIVTWPALEIVIVDNGSRDGSAELLAGAARAGVCVLLANDANRQHGPGLNQAISWLASRPGPRPAWIWILDSDVAAARPDVLAAALAAARSAKAALAGEPRWDPWHQAERFELYSLLLDPAQVWRPGIGPFTDGGDPSFDLLSSAARSGLRQAAFPFATEGHVIHRGRGSLAAVFAAGDRSHPLHDWASGHHAPHFGGVPGAAERYQALLRTFRQQTGPLTPASLAAACGYPTGPS
ncbi:MAG: glycosyltransferase family 2 protein [Streptosporangiaceae bacterium]